MLLIGSHLAAGLIIGKLTGSYILALCGALFVDLDHLISYAKNGIIFDLKKLWKTITDPKDPFGSQRNFLHSFIFWILVFLIFANSKAGFIFSLGYLSHLILDVLDGSDFRLFYPLSKINIKGPIGYLSRRELVLTLFLFIIFFIICLS